MSAAGGLLADCEVSDLCVAEVNHLLRLVCCEDDHESARKLFSITDERQVDVNDADDQLFRDMCAQGHVGIVRELLALGGDRAVNVHARNEEAFKEACVNGYTEIVCELLALTGDRAVNVHADDEAAFRGACRNGHADIVRELLALTGDRAVNVHADDEAAFRGACRNGHADIVRELLALTGDRAVNVHADDEAAFRGACRNGHADIVRELLTLTGDRAVNVHAENDAAWRGACDEGKLEVVRELLTLSPHRQPADAGEPAAQQHPPLTAGLRNVPWRHPGVAALLLRTMPLHADWLATTLYAWCSGQATAAPEDMPGPHGGDEGLPLVQQVLLGAASGADFVLQLRANFDGILGLTDADAPCTLFEVLGVCCALPGPAFDAVRRNYKPVVNQEGEHQAMLRGLNYSVMDVCWSIAWFGVVVPLTPGVPGADIARAQPGALSRPGRRAMVLRRERGSSA